MKIHQKVNKVKLKGKRTREKILKAATHLFAKYGFAGTSMDDIADMVGIKKASLYHHFPSKHDIYNELINQTLKKIIEIFRLSFSSGDIIKDARNFVKQIMFFIRENEEYVKILMRELLDENVPIRKLAQEHVPQILSFGSQILEEGKKQGVFKRDVDPIQLSITLTGAIIIYFIFRPLIEPFIKKPMSSKAIYERISHIISVILYGILEHNKAESDKSKSHTNKKSKDKKAG